MRGVRIRGPLADRVRSGGQWPVVWAAERPSVPRATLIRLTSRDTSRAMSLNAGSNVMGSLVMSTSRCCGACACRAMTDRCRSRQRRLTPGEMRRLYALATLTILPHVRRPSASGRGRPALAPGGRGVDISVCGAPGSAEVARSLSVEPDVPSLHGFRTGSADRAQARHEK